MALNRPAPTPFRHPGADRGGPVDLAAARRILVVRPDNIGDVVLLTPALRAVRAAAPQARIELLVSPAGAAVAGMIPELDGVLTVSPSWQQLTAPSDAAGDPVLVCAADMPFVTADACRALIAAAHVAAGMQGAVAFDQNGPVGRLT